ncbi:MAG TPA: tetratricopeptide repeat protein [Terriglobales bacterium]|nr:tetratricopeptide repeat protein [Terriglobales bacterium]
MDSIAMLREVLALNPNDTFARYGLAMEYVNRGDTSSALAEFATLLEANPDYAPGYQMAAQTLMKAGRDDEARKALEDGIACAVRIRNQHARSEMEAMLDELR